jgi:hypothetical protein
MPYLRKTIEREALLELIRKRLHGVRRDGDCSGCLPIAILRREPVDGTSNWLPGLGPDICSPGCSRHLAALLMLLSDEYDVVFASETA